MTEWSKNRPKQMHTDMSISFESCISHAIIRDCQRQGEPYRLPFTSITVTHSSALHNCDDGLPRHPSGATDAFPPPPKIRGLLQSVRSARTAIVTKTHTNLPTQAAPPLTHLSMNLYLECQGSKRISQLFLAIGGVGKRNDRCQHTSTIVLPSMLLQMKRNLFQGPKSLRH